MKKRKTLLVLLIIGAIFLVIYGPTLAKYTANSVWDYYLKAKDFNFSSDYLGSTTVNNSNSLWDGNSVYFNVKNNLNQTVATGYDIDYEIQCNIEGDAASATECQLNGTGTNKITGTLSHSAICINNSGDSVDVSGYNKTDCELGGYDWVNQIAEQSIYFDVVVTQGGYVLEDVIVNVTATSKAPYTKVLTGKFTLHKRTEITADVEMEYTSLTNFDRLTLSNPSVSNECVKLNWNASDFRLDAEESDFSSYNTDGSGYMNEVIFTIGSKQSKSLIFYKVDFDATHDINDFTLIKTTGC